MSCGETLVVVEWVPVLSAANGTLLLWVVMETVLVEGVLAEEVDGWQDEAPLAQTALHHLKYLRTGGVCACGGGGGGGGRG